MKHLKLFEDFQEGKIFCYHATGSKGNWRDLLKGKFKIGPGANFGPGLYTFYYLEDLQKDPDWSKSPAIIEYQISEFDKFYVEDPSIARSLFGSFSLESQVASIMGTSWIEENRDKMEKIMIDPRFLNAANIMNSNRYRREDSPEDKQKKWIFGRELKGSIFPANVTGEIFCVVYDTSLATPSRVSLDMGKNWISPTEALKEIKE